MQEAEVSLRVALYYIRNGLTDKDVTVSLDGAHIKTGNQIHFDICKFLGDNDCVRVDGEVDCWQGKYRVSEFSANIIISSKPGIGDVNVHMNDGSRLYVESKKGKSNKSGQEYPLMREAIGQLMTSVVLTDGIVPAVAVPYSDKSYELAARWADYPQIKQVGIKFLLVKDAGDILII